KECITTVRHGAERQEEASRWIQSTAQKPNTPDSKLASTVPPPQRDYFHLPSLDLSRYRAHSSVNSATPSPAPKYTLPSLEFSQAQASAYWPGAASALPLTTTRSPQHTLPTPPTDTSDRHKPPGVNPGELAAMAASQQPGMAASLEPVAASGSLSARRPAASNLGGMSLPPLPFRQNSAQKSFGGYGFDTPQPTQNSALNAGNLLTPPSNVSTESLSPISHIVNGVNASAAGQGLPSFAQSTPHWLQQQPTGTAPYGTGTGTGTAPQPWSNTIKGLFSSSTAGSLQRTNADSPTTSDGLPPPPFDLTQVSAYSNAMSSTLPTTSANQHAFAHNSLYQASHSQQQVHTPISATTVTSPPISGTQPSYMDRSHSTPTTYSYTLSQPASALASNFPPYSSTTPSIQPSPLSAPLTGASRFSPPVGHHAAFSPPHSQMTAYGLRYGSQYPLPGMSGQLHLGQPIMSNVTTPGTQMAMIGLPPGMPGSMVPEYHSGHAAQLYGNHNQPPNDRPFKCDQCPQSFNRNHDLKRHKRIHLAVKPFPCGHCDKSFSRKDALKRHILVKGCGKNSQVDNSRGDGSLGPSDDEHDHEHSYVVNVA
ncbi:MAG: hypothetical protein Q9163_004822, partial [Psora crenata]